MFGTINTNDKISNDFIECLMVDKNGFLWVATFDGLNKYDGKRWKQYKRQPQKPNSIPQNGISLVYQDSHDRIWVATDFGLCYYNPEFDNFTTPEFISPNVLNVEKIQYIKEDRSTDVIFSSTSGLKRYSYRTNTYSFFSDNIDDTINKINFPSIYYYNDTAIFAGSLGNGFWMYNTQTHNARKLFNGIDVFLNDPACFIFNITPTGNNTIWVSTSMGIAIIDTKKLVVKGMKLPGVHVRSIYKDKHQNLWINNINYPMQYVPEGSSKLIPILTFNTNEKNVKYNTASCVIEDALENYWVGTHGQGIYIIDNFKRQFATYNTSTISRKSLKSDIISCFLEQPDGKVWIGTDGGGLYLFDRDKTTFELHDVFKSKAILDVKYANGNKLWVATYGGGLNLFEPATGRNIVFMRDNKKKDGIPGNEIKKILVIDDSTLLITTQGVGLTIMNTKTFTFKTIFNDSILEANFIQNRWVNHLTRDSKNRVWISSSNGLLKLENGRYMHYSSDDSKETSINSNFVQFTLEDSQGRIWVGNNVGLDLYNEEANNFTRMRKKFNLPDNFKAGVEDNNNNLWFSTNSGMIIIDKELKKVTSLDESNGLQGNEFFAGSVMKDKNGDLYFGGLKGFNIIDPMKPSVPSIFMPIIFTEFQLFNKTQLPGDSSSVLKKDINYTDTVILNYNQSVFSIEFANLDLLGASKIKYKYRLKHFDEEWYFADNSNKVTYTNLDPGNYVFEIKATNRSGEWNESKVKRLTIMILTPWWMSWWFRLLTMITVLSWISYKVYRYKRRNKILSRMVDERTRELENSNKELRNQYVIIREQSDELISKNQEIEAQRDQISFQNQHLTIVNSKLEETIKTKDKFMSIIGHDLKNPIGAIISISELTIVNFNKYSDNKKLQFINAINSSSKHIYDLLDNILIWAKSQNGNVQFKPMSFKLQEVISTVISLLIESANKKHISLTFELEQDFTVFADKNMLYTVIRNLVSNSIKFTPRGGFTSISAKYNINDTITISITDNGVGMTDNQIEGLFKIGENRSTRGTNEETGTGLGLILCADFLKYHNSAIFVTSELNKGSVFSFDISCGNSE